MTARSISLIPASKSLSPFANNDKSILRYFLNIPSDENFFRCLFLDDQNGLFQDDLRLPFKTVPYQKLSISDKGQYLRGVIAKFKSLDEAYEALVPRFWRELIRSESKRSARECNNNENKDDDKEITTEILTFEKMVSSLITDAQHRENVKKQMRFSKNETINYIKANCMDSLEYLIHKNIIFRVHDWRCDYCGRINAISIDNLKNKNNCEVCDSSYELPVDFTCTFKLNDFVVNALSKNNGMTVLWTLGFLHNRNYDADFFYIPEVRLFDKYDDKEWAAEIDVICVLAGKLYIGEVKKSAAAFVKDDLEVNKFIEIIKRLTPDVALLSFEQYGDNAEEIDAIDEKLQKAKEKIEKCGIPIEVKLIIATEHDQEFSSHAISLYPSVGVRSEKYWR